MAATNFEELVAAIAEEAPHALVLDWYRRLELTVRSYLAARGMAYSNGPAAESIIAADPRLGHDVARELSRLRVLRNTHTHGWQALIPLDAVQYARAAFALMGCVMRAENSK